MTQTPQEAIVVTITIRHHTDTCDSVSKVISVMSQTDHLSVGGKYKASTLCILQKTTTALSRAQTSVKAEQSYVRGFSSYGRKK